jgi:hypothetical protein
MLYSHPRCCESLDDSFQEFSFLSFDTKHTSDTLLVIFGVTVIHKNVIRRQPKLDRFATNEQTRK